MEVQDSERTKNTDIDGRFPKNGLVKGRFWKLWRWKGLTLPWPVFFSGEVGRKIMAYILRVYSWIHAVITKRRSQ